ncbi:Retrovirus-related Pol polyprotein from transposon 297 [Eumeta japonica]|uniref:RNA-directed DNA polymerase n=1 Tax=Eumeta variegata TaxID=151549 RepID=A0A4C1SPB9_EUMVA|nr:Retrovirus-related Pol polyprotein from transposon 297 [Eumeta japonica]
MGLGCTDLLQHHIDTGDATPIKCKHFPMSPPRQAEAFEEVERLLRLGVIEESNSPWCSPVVLVRNQERLTDSSKEKTAFVVPGKPLYHYKFMPFGLCNGPQTMSRLMDRVIPSRLRENVFIYLDDLLVCSSDFDSHIKLLNEVATCLKAAKLTINVSKSKFCQKEIRYLGYIVGNGCLKVDPSKVESIKNFPLPKTVKQIRRFIGMANWYRAFICNFADLAGPLSDCLKKSKNPFMLTEEAKISFEKLKEALSSAPVLAQPNFNKEFIIQCDASKIGVGGVLLQYDDEGKEHPIAFVSQKLNKAQRNYTITELECLAAIVSVNRFRPYIEGLPFRIITDHASLKWLMSQKDLSGRLARWSLKLQRYTFTIEHRKGSLNVVPDCLSRMNTDELVVKNLPTEIDLRSPAFEEKEYQQLRKSIVENKETLPDLQISGNVVLKRVEFRQHAENDEETYWRLWVPKSLIQQVIKSSHDSCSAGHGGFMKTMKRLRQKYFWPSMTLDVKSYVDNCDICKCIKASNQISRPQMGNQVLTNRPFERVVGRATRWEGPKRKTGLDKIPVQTSIGKI